MCVPSQMHTIGLVATVVAGTLSFALPAASDESEYCGERQDILRVLKGRLHERQTALGRTSDGRILEVFAAQSGSWTVLVTYPSGLSCLVTRGVEWRQIERQQTGPALQGDS